MAPWTEKQRTCVRLLFESEPYKELSANERLDIFNFLYQGERGISISAKQLKDAYSRRLEPKSAKEWRRVCDTDSPTVEEAARRMEMRRQVGLEMAEAVKESQSTAAPETDEPPLKKTKTADALPNGPAVADGHPLPCVCNTAGDVDPAATRNLEMLHYRHISWKLDGPLCTRKGYVDHEAEVYKLGGKAYKVQFEDGKLGDVMICNSAACAYCLTRDESKTHYQDLGLGDMPEEAKVLQGRPFVHSRDCAFPSTDRTPDWNMPKVGPTGMPVLQVFRGSSREYQESLPRALFTPLLVFRGKDGEEILVSSAMCQVAFCAQCSGKKAIQIQ